MPTPPDPSEHHEPGILHVDMDAFFVSVELLDQPELRGKPVIVGGSGDRGVVAAASYEARSFGVHSAMPSVRARRLCPHAVFLAGRYDRYVEVSNAVMAIFKSFTPLVEPISLDEAFLDVRGARRLHGPAPTIAARIRERVLDEEGLTCSVGVAPTKFVAKLASEAAKPRAAVAGPQPGLGVKVVEPDDVLAFLHPLPVQALWGVGPATLARLERLGIVTVGDLAAMPLPILTGTLGNASGSHLHALANGVDPRAVEPDRKAKSIGHEETFAVDQRDRQVLEGELMRFADAIATRLRANDLAGRTVTIKVRFHDFRTITRSITLGTPSDDSLVIAREAKHLFTAIDPSIGIRLLGVHVSGLTTEPVQQLTFDDVDAPSWTDANKAVDEIRARFGSAAIGPATIATERGLRVKRRGEQQWGPDQGLAGGGGAGPHPADDADPEEGSAANR
jgi:DNA polymerase-4